MFCHNRFFSSSQLTTHNHYPFMTHTHTEHHHKSDMTVRWHHRPRAVAMQQKPFVLWKQKQNQTIFKLLVQSSGEAFVILGWYVQFECEIVRPDCIPHAGEAKIIWIGSSFFFQRKIIPNFLFPLFVWCVHSNSSWKLLSFFSSDLFTIALGPFENLFVDSN